MMIAETVKKTLQDGLWNKTDFSGEQQALKDNFHKALAYIKKMPGNKPWYLMIGPIHSGKTSLLTHSRLHFNYTNHLVQFTPTEYENLGHNNWWVSKKGVFIDVPGRYLNLEEEKTPQLWLDLLKLLRKHQAPLKGILLTLSVAELATYSKLEQEAYSRQLRQRIQELAEIIRIPYLPIDLFLCKADLLAGFIPFFDDLGYEECAQPVGIRFSQAPTLNQFNLEFDNLLKRLNARLIWRIHQERNLHKRTLIKDYPLQLASLKSSLGRIIYYLSVAANYNNKLTIRSIYFTSSLQQGTPIDCLLRTLSTSFELAPTWLEQPHRSKPYFIKQCLSQYLIDTASKRFTKTFKANASMFNYALIGLVLISCLFVYRYSSDAHERYKNADNLLTYAQQLINQRAHPSLLQTIQAEHALQNAQAILPTIHMPGLATKPSLQAATQLQQSIQKRFGAALKAELEKQLLTEQDPSNLYLDLKAYKALNNPKSKDLALLQAWLERISKAHLSKDWLNSALAMNPLPLDQAVITQAQNVLASIPYEKLAYSMLKSHYNKMLSLTEISQMDANQTNLIFNTYKPQISEFYTADNLQQIYYKDIPELCQAIIQDQALLGKTKPDNVSIDVLKNIVRKIYITDYLNQWLYLFKNIELNTPIHLNDLQALIRSLATPTSPLWRLLHTITTNIESLNSLPITANNSFSSLAGQFIQQASLIELIKNFNKLQAVLDNINDVQATFNLVAARMENPMQDDPLLQLQTYAKRLPLPLQSWLLTITQNTWNLLFDKAKQHIEDVWLNTILPFYKERIAERYPLQKAAVRDIAINDFIQFFGPDGLLDNFLKQKLKPFIDMRQAQWHWRQYAGKTLPYSEQTLMEFERASIIRTMFFPNKQANIAINFTLMPLALASHLSQSTLLFNDQRISYHGDNSTLEHITWTGDTDNLDAQLIWRDKNGKSHMLSEKGPWSLFRLLDKAQVKTTIDTQHLQIDFDLNGFSASYALVAQYPINPFIPNVIDKFYCPDPS